MLALQLRQSIQNRREYKMPVSINGTGAITVSNGVPLTVNTLGLTISPNRPAFHAYGPQSYTSYATGTKITKYTSTYFNVGNGYDTTLCRFTAPVGGTYLFHYWGLTSAAQSGSISLYINGGERMRTYFGGERARTVTLVAVLSLNDYVEAYCNDTGLDQYGYPYGGFCGTLIG